MFQVGEALLGGTAVGQPGQRIFQGVAAVGASGFVEKVVPLEGWIEREKGVGHR